VENFLEWKWTFKVTSHLSLQDQEDVSNLVEQLSSKDWQERMQAIDTMAEMIETRLPLFTSNIVKVKSLISFVHFPRKESFVKCDWPTQIFRRKLSTSKL
jgi:hypothetical protein